MLCQRIGIIGLSKLVEAAIIRGCFNQLGYCDVTAAAFALADKLFHPLTDDR